MQHKFFVGRCDVDLHIDNCQSLKEKRRVISSLKEKLKARFNIAICEYGDLSLWQRTQLGITTCSNDRTVVDSMLKAVLNYLEKFHTVSTLNFKIDVL
jgi:uncharacterized protein YlxP (DUF503 family)